MAQRNKIPQAVIRELRREVGFGCPVCRSPFLTWHHFDPPYHVEAHNRPEGMIALCREHHDEADQGHYSPGELHALKKAHPSSDDVKGNFPSWRKQSILIRVGGSYFGGCRAVVSVMGYPIIELSKNEAEMLSLSFALMDEGGQVIVRMVENAFEAYPRNVHDLSVTTRKGSVMVWLKQRDIGLDLSFSRITPEELDSVLSKDRERAKVNAKKALEEWEKEQGSAWPAEMKQLLAEAMSGPPTLPPGAEKLPAAIREAHLSGDPVGHRVKSWSVQECMADDGLIPFLNFEQMAIFHHGERITIRNGIGGIDYCAAFNSFGGVNLQCPCASCSPPMPPPEHT